jgi:hypothetical protein
MELHAYNEAPMNSRIARCSAVVGVVAAVTLAFAAGEARAQTPTFSKDVAPILYKHCTTCHRPGEIAPMSLLTYEQSRPWARAIRDNVRNDVMPPWHADPAHGKWANDRSMTAAEKDTIVKWVDGGAPEGNKRDLPKAPEYTEGWTIGKPDAVVTMKERYSVPATGEIPYQYFELETNFTEDRWVQALEVRPGNRAVVHHILVYARAPQTTRRPPAFRMQNPPGPLSPTQMKEMLAAKENPEIAKRMREESNRRGNLIAQIAPGTNATVFAPGSAMLLPAGTTLTFQVHYTTNGEAGTDQSSIGFKFAPQPPTREVYATAMMNPRFMIPAGAANHPVEAKMEFLEDVTIYSMAPHTHLRGKAWHYTLTYPDGRSEVILSVPRYDFNWQTDYVFATPLRVPKGSILTSVAHYDNSKENKANPDPTQPVYWGDQTWEEMQYTGIMYSIDKEARTTSAQQR